MPLALLVLLQPLLTLFGPPIALGALTLESMPWLMLKADVTTWHTPWLSAMSARFLSPFICLSAGRS